MSNWTSIERVISKVEYAGVIISYTLIIVLVGAETIRRMILGHQSAWAPGLAIYALVWMSWFAMGRFITTGEHVAFGMLRARFPLTIRCLLQIFDALWWLALGAVIIFFSFHLLKVNYIFSQRLFGTPIPLYILNSLIPLSWGLCSIRAIALIWVSIVSISRQQDLLPRQGDTAASFE